MGRTQREETAGAGNSLLSPELRCLNAYNRIRKKAMDLLMRREHAMAELQKKLEARDYDVNIVSEVVAQLASEGLVSDARFTEAFVRYRCNNGRGPQRIQS